MTAEKKQTTASKVASVVSIPGYEIKDLLGRGGMATVYLAIQTSIGRKVALKVLSPDHTDETFSERFLREARIASQLSHPNVITVFDAGIHNGIHYMSMEYIKGKSFNEARDILTRKQKITVIKQIAQALDFASKNGFLHRDIKPENILLHQDGRAILTDFGIAKTSDVSKGLTETGKILGTPYFMSPEQTKGLQIDHRTDIYSLGVVLFQALAGYVPYDGPSLVAICIKHLSDPIPQLPKGLEIFQPIINICLSKKPEHRYQHASELYDALNKISDSQIDAIEENTKSLKQAGKDHNAATMAETGIKNTPPTQQKKKSPATQNHINRTNTNATLSHNYIKPSGQTNIIDSNEFKNLNRRNKRILLLLLILAVSVGYYKKTELTVIWKSKGEPLAKQYLPAEIKKHLFTEKTKKIVAQEKIKPEVIKLTAEQLEDKKLRDLINTIDKIPSNALILADTYRKKLTLNPADQETINANDELRKWYLDRALSLISKKEFHSAVELLNTIKSTYPDITQSNEFASLNEKLYMEQLNEPHLQKSRVYFAVNALNTPKGANALDELKIVLNNDPDNKEALDGLQKIVSYYILKSQTQIKNKQYFDALNSVNSGLQAIHNDTELLSLQKEIKSLINSDSNVKNLILKAEKLLTSGYLINPKGINAYNLYKQVLTTDKNNIAAKKGLLKIHKDANKKAALYISQNKFLEASEIISTAIRLYPESTELGKLKKNLKKEMDAVLPIVPKIKISDTQFSEITQTTLRKIKIGQLLYIGFDYNNFTQDNTSIKVNVYNGQLQNSSTLNAGLPKLIIQKSITITGNKGNHFFTVQLPNKGIINGNYSIELMFGKARLIKANLFGLH